MIKYETVPINDLSVALGKRLSSSSNAISPIGFDKNMSKTGLLSTKSINSTGIPSFTYSCERLSKMISLHGNVNFE